MAAAPLHSSIAGNPIRRNTVHSIASSQPAQAQTSRTSSAISHAASIPTCPFEKHFDPQTGRYYHIHKESGESVWDVPASHANITLSAPSADSQIAAATEAQQYATEQARKRQERIAIAQQYNLERRTEDEKARKQSHQAEQSRQYALWRAACERGGIDTSTTDGSVRVSWQKLGYISTQIYDFERDFGRKLTRLCIEGNSLQSIGAIPVYCTHLVHLSLASNNIQQLDGDISKLHQLQRLNLLQNQLEILPNEIGELSELRELEVAGNCLVELPPSICLLHDLKRLNVECNSLRELPEHIGDMACQELNANSNALSSLPCSIVRMPNLRHLCINDNRIDCLPLDVGNLRHLEVLHASKNRISELPTSICRLASLQSLWLDFNKTTALPADFYQLRRLQELKMEGNPDMVLPPVEKLVEGARAVLRWSECRYASSKNARQQSIVMSVQDILRQVGQNMMLFSDYCQPLDSMFEANVEFKGHLFYQFLPDALWTVFIPKLKDLWSRSEHVVGIRSFTYDRRDVEQALLEFRDAGGRVARHDSKARFRRCSCKNNSEGKKACNQQRSHRDTMSRRTSISRRSNKPGGWACQRPALFLRMSLVKEKDMAEKRRTNVEKARIDAAVESAELGAKRHLSSDEGQQHIRKQAEERVVAEALSKLVAADANHDDDGSDADNEDVPSTFETSTTVSIGSTVRQEIARRAAVVKIRLHPNFGRKVQRMEEKIRRDYISSEVDRRRMLAEETNRKMKTIRHNWLGMSVDEAFREWRTAIRRAKRGKRRDMKAKMRTERLKYESELALKEYAKRQLLLWDEYWDEYNDAPYWINRHTDESTYEEPRLERFLPEGWSMPDLPSHMVDRETGNMLSRPEVREAEMDTDESSSEEDDSGYESPNDAANSMAASRGSKVSFLLPDDRDEEGKDNANGKVGAEAEAKAAAERILERRKHILLLKRQNRENH